jgi:hypothetical protein
MRIAFALFDILLAPIVYSATAAIAVGLWLTRENERANPRSYYDRD